MTCSNSNCLLGCSLLDCLHACMQTGTAERFSKQLGNELRRKYGEGVVVEVVDIENYKAETRLPKEKLVLYLMATYGERENGRGGRVCPPAQPQLRHPSVLDFGPSLAHHPISSKQQQQQQMQQSSAQPQINADTSLPFVHMPLHLCAPNTPQVTVNPPTMQLTFTAGFAQKWRMWRTAPRTPTWRYDSWGSPQWCFVQFMVVGLLWLLNLGWKFTTHINPTIMGVQGIKSTGEQQQLEKPTAAAMPTSRGPVSYVLLCVVHVLSTAGRALWRVWPGQQAV